MFGKRVVCSSIYPAGTTPIDDVQHGKGNHSEPKIWVLVFVCAAIMISNSLAATIILPQAS